MNKKGFTIIETMVSVLLIMIAVVQVAYILIHSLRLSKKTKDIFYMHQMAGNLKNQLLSSSFNSLDLMAGETIKDKDGYKIHWKIIDRSDSLKEINLLIKKKGISKKYFFIKAKNIN